MLSGSDHVKVSETKWQYRKNRCLPGHVKKGKQAAFFLFFSFSIYDSGLWKCFCQTMKYRNSNQWKKNECEYEIIYWKKHSWSLLFEVIQRATRKALSHAPIARRRVHTSSCFLLLSTRYQFVNKITKQSSILSNFWRLTWKLSLQPSFSSCDICWVVFYNQ